MPPFLLSETSVNYGDSTMLKFTTDPPLPNCFQMAFIVYARNEPIDKIDWDKMPKGMFCAVIDGNKIVDTKSTLLN